MPPGSPKQPPVDAWATEAQSHLDALTGAVVDIERILGVGVVDGAPVAALAARLLSAIERLLKWLRESEPPADDLRVAAGELAAAAGVYRNAALLFKSLPAADSQQRAARLTACSNMLSQGIQHVERFTDELRSQYET